ncbi:MAG: zinc-dependent alcohol dehydrogenase family protein [Phycisphaerae bacterium]
MVLNKPAPIEKKPLQLIELPIPKPQDNEILIKVSVCGACHTDLDEAEGRLLTTKSPVIPGHQIVGIVAAKGKNANRFKTGDRVGVTWLYWACGDCSFCETGQENLCENSKWTGKDADGGYAEYMVIEQDFAYSLPEEFSDLQAAPLLCAGVVGYRALRLANITDGQTIGMFGFGACAHIIIQVVKYKYPNSPVFVFTKSEHHINLAKKLGADWTGRSGDKPPALLDKALDFTPAGECVRDALGVLQRGGRLVINAIRKETPIPAMDYAEYLWLEREIKSVANVTKADAEEFLPIAAEIGIKPTVEEFPLEQANEVLFKMKHSQLKAAAVLKI